MSSVERLNELLADPEQGLDRILAVIATIDPKTPPTESVVVARIDELAAHCPERSGASTILDHVYGTLGFSGDLGDYYDPANSLIHHALHRRRGIPLTLGAIAAEVGRRRGVDLRLIGMPGHVLLADGSEADRWYDPFNRGAQLGYEDCRGLFAQFHPEETFSPAMLKPMTAEAVAIRTLNNLRAAYTRRGNPWQVIPVMEMRANMASADIGDRIELANMLAGLGRYDQAADEFTRLSEMDPERAAAYLAKATSCLSHRN